MLLRGRTESDELLSMRYLNIRKKLTEQEKFRLLNLEKGYEGEVKFDQLAEGLHEERYIINDLLLVVNNSYVQIDTLIISQSCIHLLDIKNFQFECYLDSDNLYAVTNDHEYKNPLDQLKRAKTLLRQLLQILKGDFLIEAYVIFINPEFTLFQASKDLPIILPTQLNRFLTNINNTPSKLNEEHKKLAQKLISLHQTKNPFAILPKYNYDQLQKGFYCKTCNSFSVCIKNFDLVCSKCNEHEKIEQAIVRNVKEFVLLFPERKITTQNIYEWCKADLNKKTIRRVLKKNYNSFGKTRETYYE